MKTGSFSEHQNKTSDTDRYKRYSSTARVSQVNLNTMKRIFEQRSELLVDKCLTVHVLSSSFSVSNLELRNKRKVSQQWNLRVVNDILLNQVRAYHERVCRQCRKHILVCEVLFFSTLLQTHYEHYFQKCVHRSVLKHARPDLLFARQFSTFCVLRDTLTVIQISF